MREGVTTPLEMINTDKSSLPPNRKFLYALYEDFGKLEKLFLASDFDVFSKTIQRHLISLESKEAIEAMWIKSVIKLEGKHPFLWHDHWLINDYATVFECLDLVDELSAEVSRVAAKIREMKKSFAKYGAMYM